MNLLEIKNLKMDFGIGADALRAVDGVSLTIGAGETVCLVGESGCGKSVTALSIAQLVPMPPANYVGGEILLNGRDVLKMSKPRIARHSRRRGELCFSGTGRVAESRFPHRQPDQGIAQAAPDGYWSAGLRPGANRRHATSRVGDRRSASANRPPRNLTPRSSVC